MKLGIHQVVGLFLCKLVADKLFVDEEEVVGLEALVHKAGVEAHFSMTMIVSKQS